MAARVADTAAPTLVTRTVMWEERPSATPDYRFAAEAADRVARRDDRSRIVADGRLCRVES